MTIGLGVYVHSHNITRSMVFQNLGWRSRRVFLGGQNDRGDREEWKGEEYERNQDLYDAY